MAVPTRLRNQFLLSMPHLDDPHFAQTLTYICEHGDYGAMGLVINRSTGLNLPDLLSHLDLPPCSPTLTPHPIYDGGPVHQDRGFVLHGRCDDSWLNTQDITPEISVTSSMDILEAIASGQGPEDFLITLGYAGWGPGQLEEELSNNLWLSCPFNFDIMFRMPAEERLNAAASMLGINLNLLTAHAGHA
ncbi:YqgE/AlgH family protein [Marinobacterium sp. YM272]|uniref:YqgE/AlgH family protein n=1 Tax=Marinobacterium sp. YM272 TaxID=3421654 RepID=UPI003D7FC2C3